MQQHVIPFNQGIHLTPSASEDGHLADCINLIPKDGSLRNTPVLSDLQTTLAQGHTIAYIHHIGTQSNIITKSVLSGSPTQTAFYLHPYESGDNPILTLTSPVTLYRITSIGNTLIFLTSEGMHYLLWKESGYLKLGTHMPEITIQMSLSDDNVSTESISKNHIDPDFKPSSFTHEPADSDGIVKNTIGFEDDIYQKAFNDAIFAEVNKLMNEKVAKEGHFANPFFVRYAYRLYDNSLVMHSAPIFLNMAPNIGIYTEEEGTEVNGDYYYHMKHIIIVEESGDDHTVGDPEVELEPVWNFSVKPYKLQYEIKSNLTEIKKWSDIIKSIDIFISQPFYNYDQSGKIETLRHEINNNTHMQTLYVDLPAVERQEELINNCGQFYFVKSISIEETDNNTHDINVKGLLEALPSREQMTDDYDSHDTLIPKYSFAYNQRLNIANIIKGLFKGFTYQQISAPIGEGLHQDFFTMAITYHTQQGNISFRFPKVENITFPNEWRYYTPSTNPATLRMVAAFDGGVHSLEINLTSHSLLNGYYAIIQKSAFTTEAPGSYATLEAELPITSDSTTITLPNKLYTSEINNPFFFPVSGINTIGIGEIKGICSAVKALSTGQFGQFPLYVFSTDGIWAIEVKDDGTYSVKQPVTRDVLDNPNSITQLDTAVLYTTQRGLYLLTGSETHLLTAQLEASIEDLSTLLTPLAPNPLPLTCPSLFSILPTARLSYDGINNIVHIYPPLLASDGSPVTPTPASHYILHLDTMQWARTTQPIPVAFVDGYPNATLQVNVTTTENNVTTTTAKLYQYALPTYSPTSLQAGFLLTRETALGDPHTYKLLNDLRTLHHYRTTTETGRGVKVLVLVSNDRTTWQPLRSLKSRSYLWYRFAIFTNLADSDILEALTLQTDERRTNKLR